MLTFFLGLMFGTGIGVAARNKLAESEQAKLIATNRAYEARINRLNAELQASSHRLALALGPNPQVMRGMRARPYYSFEG